MKLKFTLSMGVLLFYSVMSFAADLIECHPKKIFADAGFYVNIQKSSSGYIYTFSEDNIAGKKELKRKEVTLKSLKMSHSCKISVYPVSSSSSAPMFYIVKSSRSKQWILEGAGNDRVPDLVCDIDKSYVKKNCDDAKSFEPIGINPRQQSNYRN